MKKNARVLRNLIVKHGNIIASCAFAFVAFTSNSSSMVLFYEPKEPAGVGRFKKFDVE